MGIVRCFDQLHVHAHRVSALLHASFQDVGHPQSFADIGQVLRRAFVMLRRCARDNLQISNLRQTRENFVLDAIGKVGVFFVAA